MYKEVCHFLSFHSQVCLFAGGGDPDPFLQGKIPLPCKSHTLPRLACQKFGTGIAIGCTGRPGWDPEQAQTKFDPLQFS